MSNILPEIAVMALAALFVGTIYVKAKKDSRKTR